MYSFLKSSTHNEHHLYMLVEDRGINGFLTVLKISKKGRFLKVVLRCGVYSRRMVIRVMGWRQSSF